jgi:hypothetical protein
MNMTTTVMLANSYDSADDEYNMTSPRNQDWIAVRITIFSLNNFQQLHIQQFTYRLRFKGYIYDKFVDPPSTHYLMKWDANGAPIAHFHHDTNWVINKEYILMGEPAIVHHFTGNFKSIFSGKVQQLQWNKHSAITDSWFQGFKWDDRAPL